MIYPPQYFYLKFNLNKHNEPNNPPKKHHPRLHNGWWQCPHRRYYNIERDFKSGSILFLRLDKKDETPYEAQLSVKSKHSDKGTWTTSGEKWCEQIDGVIPPQYLLYLEVGIMLSNNLCVFMDIFLNKKQGLKGCNLVIMIFMRTFG
jgi:hypothetical protein